MNIIQRQLGHANLGVTSIYLQGIDNGEIIDTVRADARDASRQCRLTSSSARGPASASRAPQKELKTLCHVFWERWLSPARDTAWEMSEENVERACRLIEHANRTGELGPDFDSLFHPEMEFEDEIGASHTRDEVRAFLQGFAQAIGDLHLEVEETRDLGDVIMLVVQQSGRGSASGVPIAQRFTWVMRFANDRCVRWRIYADHGRALEDAGLSE